MYPVDSASWCMCVCVCGCQYFMMWLTLSTEHEQTVRLDSLSVEHPSPVSLPSLALFLPHYHSLCPTLLLCLSILISLLPSVFRSIFHFRFNLLTSSHSSSSNPSPSCSVFLSWPVNLSSPPSLSLMKSICLSMQWWPVNHHKTVSKMCIHVDLVYVCIWECVSNFSMFTRCTQATHKLDVE